MGFKGYVLLSLVKTSPLRVGRSGERWDKLGRGDLKWVRAQRGITGATEDVRLTRRIDVLHRLIQAQLYLGRRFWELSRKAL